MKAVVRQVELEEPLVWLGGFVSGRDFKLSGRQIALKPGPLQLPCRKASGPSRSLHSERFVIRSGRRSSDGGDYPQGARRGCEDLCGAADGAAEPPQLEALIRKGKNKAQRLLKAHILLKADALEDDEEWSKQQDDNDNRDPAPRWSTGLSPTN